VGQDAGRTHPSVTNQLRGGSRRDELFSDKPGRDRSELQSVIISSPNYRSIVARSLRSVDLPYLDHPMQNGTRTRFRLDNVRLARGQFLVHTVYRRLDQREKFYCIMKLHAK
jgi:hypothetical protein